MRTRFGASAIDFASIADWATVAATLLAIAAIIVAVAQGVSNSRQILDQRYVTLQIELLKDLADIVNGSYYVPTRESTGRAGTLRRRAANSRLRVIDAELPTVRARYSVYSSTADLMAALRVPEGDDNINDKRIGGDGPRVRDQMYDEITDALSRLARADSREIRALRSRGRSLRA